MTSRQQEVLAELAALRDGFAAVIGESIDAIAADFAAVSKHGDGPALADLLRQVHNLAGTAGTFGIVGVQKAAAELETQLECWDDRSSRFRAEAALARLKDVGAATRAS